MSRVFPGGTSTDNLAATIAAYNSGPWSMFAWFRRDGGGGGGNSRLIQIGSGTSGQIFYFSGDTQVSLEQQFVTSQMLQNRSGIPSGWTFGVYCYDGSTSVPGDDGGTTHDEIAYYEGNVTTAMAQSGTGNTTAGSGARTTGLTDLRIGNRASGLNRCLNGALFCVGMVPYILTLAEAESLRQGDMSVLLDHDAPIFLFGLEGTDLSSHAGYGPSLTLTATGTTTTTDPITLDWTAGGANITGTSATVTVVAGTGQIGVEGPVSGVAGTVIVVAGTGQVGTTEISVHQVTGQYGTPGSGTVTTPNITTVAGSVLVAYLGVYNIDTTVGATGDITDSFGNTWVFKDKNMGGISAANVLVYEQIGGTRGSCTITADIAGAQGTINIHVIELIGVDSESFDTTTVGKASDAVNPLDVAAGGAISGTQIGLYCVAVTDTAGGNPGWTGPSGYTSIYNNPDAQYFVSYAGYKLNETGTPTVGATWNAAITNAREMLVTYKLAGSSVTNITGTPGTVIVVAGTGQIGVEGPVSGIAATVLVFTGTGVIGPPTVLYPATISGRKWLDQNGDVFLIKCCSSWSLAENLTNAEMDDFLEALVALGFNSVIASLPGHRGPNGSGWNWQANQAGDPYWTTTAANDQWNTSLGPGWSSYDHLMEKATELGMVVIFSIYIGGSDGSGSPPTGNEGVGPVFSWQYNRIGGPTYLATLENIGEEIATRFADYPNIVWHVGADRIMSYLTEMGQACDALFHGFANIEGASPRFHISEPDCGAIIGQSALSRWDNDFDWFTPLSADSFYCYDSDQVTYWDDIYNNYTIPVWDCEPPYIEAEHTTGRYNDAVTRLKLRERPYVVAFRNGIGINWGYESIMGFDQGTWYGQDTVAEALASVEIAEASYTWALIDTYCKDATWIPDSGTFLTTGLGTGYTKAASGHSDTAAMVYFPSSRTVAVDTTVIAGSGNVRLRWFDPTTGGFTTIAESEAQQANRSITYPGNNSTGDSDWVLVVDAVEGGATEITGTSATVLTVAGTGAVSGNASVTGTSATVLTVAGTGTIGVSETNVTGTGATVYVYARVGQIDATPPDPVKVADRGIRTSTGAGDATVTLTNPTAITVGNYLVARVSVDNSGGGGARPGLTCSDARNGTWTHGTGGLQDPSSANLGVATYLCYVKVTTPYQAGDTVLFDYTTGTPLSAIVIEEWANINKTTPLAVSENQANNLSSTAQPAISRTPTLVKQLMYVCAGLEGFSSYWGAQDSDTTGGSWGDVTKDEANTGTASSSVSVYGGYKVVTSTAAQTWNNTIGTASDWAACAVVFAKEYGTTSIVGIDADVAVQAGVGQPKGEAAVTGTSATVIVAAGTGTIGSQVDVSGTPATVLVEAGTGTIGFPATDVTGTGAVVTVIAGTGTISSEVNITGTSATVLVIAGTGVVGAQTDISGTSATVDVVSSTGTIGVQTDITGTSATVLVIAGTGIVEVGLTGIGGTVDVIAGTGIITGHASITGTSTTVLIVSGTGAVTGNASVTGTSAIVIVVSEVGQVGSGAGITGTSGTVYVIAGTGQITATTAITGTGGTVNTVAGTGTISVNLIGTGGTVAVVAGTGQITATTPVTGTSATILVTAGTGTIIVGADVVGNSGTVYVVAGTGSVSGHTAITGTGATVTVIAGTGVISRQITGTGATVIVISGTGQITGHTSISGTTATVVVIAGIGPVARVIPPAKQGAILVM